MELLKGKNDFYTSIEKSLSEIDDEWERYVGLIIAGTHTPDGINEKIAKIKDARERHIPYLGICFGMQLMAIEFARNVLGIKDATSEEFGGKGTPVVKKLPELRVGLAQVGWPDGTVSTESHWHNFAIDPDCAATMAHHGYIISSAHVIPEIIRYKNHPFFMGVQFHPEYQSNREHPHRILKEFIDICSKHTVDGLRV